MRHVFFFLLIASGALAADRPNILFLFSDEHAIKAVSAYGGTVAQGGDGKPGRRQGLHVGRECQGWAQTLVEIAATVEHAALRLFVDAMVVRHVAARAQHTEEAASGVLRFEGFGDQVVPG